MMNKLSKIAFLSVLSLSANAELCIDNETGLSENFFSFEFIKDPVIDRGNPKKPLLTSPQELTHPIRLGDDEYWCIDVSSLQGGQAGYLAILANDHPLNNKDERFHMTKNVISPIDNQTTILRVTAPSKGKVKVKQSVNNGSWKEVPVEIIIGLGKSKY